MAENVFKIDNVLNHVLGEVLRNRIHLCALITLEVGRKILQLMYVGFSCPRVNDFMKYLIFFFLQDCINAFIHF